MECIITRNVDDYKKSIIPVYTPAELLKQIEIIKTTSPNT